MTKFDTDTLRALRDTEEVAIRTKRHPGTRDLVEGAEATLEIAGRRLVVRAVPASDAAAVDLASHADMLKYQPSPYLQSIPRPELLQTTLRLEPR